MVNTVTLSVKLGRWKVARTTSFQALAAFLLMPCIQNVTPAGASEKVVTSQVGDCHLLKKKQFQSRLAELKKVPCKSLHNVEVYKVGPLPRTIDALNLNSVEFGGSALQLCPRPANTPEELNSIRMTVIKASAATRNRDWFRCELFQENESGEIQRWKGKKIQSTEK
jgi:hypothetical protein